MSPWSATALPPPALIATFDRAETRYESRPNPDTAPAYSDYLHLARVKEWGAIAGEDGA